MNSLACLLLIFAGDLQPGQFVANCPEPGSFVANAVDMSPAGPQPEDVSPKPHKSDTKPVVILYTMANCIPCATAKRELDAAKDLPFTVDVRTNYPAWVTSLPTLVWDTPDGPRQIVGWPGLPDVLAKFERSRAVASAATGPVEAAPTPLAEVVRVIALLPTPETGFVDFGCGDGRWLFAAHERWPGVRITGVEIDPERASATRERVRLAGLQDRITVITGDATTTDVQADVATAYLYADVLESLRPRLEKLRVFASYQHRPPGLPVTQNGDSWIYSRPVVAARPMAVWQGQLYSGPVCDRPGCVMCRSILNQLGQR